MIINNFYIQDLNLSSGFEKTQEKSNNFFIFMIKSHAHNEVHWCLVTSCTLRLYYYNEQCMNVNENYNCKSYI
jgi:hypothetical protein